MDSEVRRIIIENAGYPLRVIIEISQGSASVNGVNTSVKEWINVLMPILWSYKQEDFGDGRHDLS